MPSLIRGKNNAGKVVAAEQGCGAAQVAACPAASGVRMRSDSGLPDGNRFISVFKQKKWLFAICLRLQYLV